MQFVCTVLPCHAVPLTVFILCICQTDVYALGMLAYELWSEAPPWSGYSAIDDITRQVVEGLRPDLPPSVPSDVRPLIEQCWHHSALSRPTADEVVQRLAIVIASLPHAAITHSTTTTELRQMPPCQFVDRAYYKRNCAMFADVHVDRSVFSVAEWRCSVGVLATPRVSVDGAAGLDLLGRTVLSCIEDNGDNCVALRSGLIVRAVEIVVVPSTNMKRAAFLEKVNCGFGVATDQSLRLPPRFCFAAGAHAGAAVPRHGQPRLTALSQVAQRALLHAWQHADAAERRRPVVPSRRDVALASASRVRAATPSRRHCGAAVPTGCWHVRRPVVRGVQRTANAPCVPRCAEP